MRREIEQREKEMQEKKEKEGKELTERILCKMEEKLEKMEKWCGIIEERKEGNDVWKEVRKIKKKIVEQEKKERKNNIIIKGLRTGKENVREKVETFLKEELEVTGGIKKTELRGTQNSNVALVELENWEKKQEVMSKKSRLDTKRIYIEYDLTYEERKVQVAIREKARKLQEEGKVVKVGYRKLNIQGKWFHWNDEEEELQEGFFQK